MPTFFQTGDSEQRPVWLRLLAMLCVLVVCMTSTVLAYHTHADFSALKQNSQHNSPATDDHCPLCVAMHSVVPFVVMVAAVVLVKIGTATPVMRETRTIIRYWHPTLFNRPPPAGC